MRSILILLHCESNTGYAIGPLESTFFAMAKELCDGDISRIHFAYPSMTNGPSQTLPADFRQYAIIDAATSNHEHMVDAERYISLHGIDTIFGFDQPVSRPIYRHFRNAGVKHFISYWGAPMSSLFGPIKILAKRIEVMFRRNGPDHYVFESKGMAETAYRGRGVPITKTSVVHLGIDTEAFRPDPSESSYVYDELGIPKKRRIFFYAGHMEERKGVAVIMRAANILAKQRKSDDWQIVLFGNQAGQESRYIQMLDPGAEELVKFGGYRNDLPSIQRGCYAAIIASTGWDSFPRSAIEMQATGLPLLASDLPGLRESIIPEETGYLFPSNDAQALAENMRTLLDNQTLRDRLSACARTRAVSKFSLEAQLEALVNVVRTATSMAK